MKNYDSRCGDLADVFLQNEPSLQDKRDELAAHIQAAIEDWISSREELVIVQPNCELCGEPMPAGEEMFKYHGYSGPCPKRRMTAPALTPDVCDNG
jgi:hypothetical protein